MKISVVIPTRNGGSRWVECLAAIAAQAGAPAHEVIVVDSGSTDGTLEVARSCPVATVISIAPREFQHGATRNRAWARARGELVAFLTQDAVPLPGWLAAWNDFMDRHPEVAGAFGGQVAHPGADPLEALDVASHFASFGRDERIFLDRTSALAGRYVPAEHFLSNVNSCMRRAVLEELPFPEIEFGEDQAWAVRAHAAGLATGYAPRAVVHHSHDYGTLMLLRRRYDEARFMARAFDHRIAPSWRRTRELAAADAARYAGHLRSLGHPGAGAAWRRAWANALGHYAGTRLAQRDGALHRMLSLHASRVSQGAS